MEKDMILKEARASVALDGETQSEETATLTLDLSQWGSVVNALLERGGKYDEFIADYIERQLE